MKSKWANVLKSLIPHQGGPDLDTTQVGGGKFGTVCFVTLVQLAEEQLRDKLRSCDLTTQQEWEACQISPQNMKFEFLQMVIYLKMYGNLNHKYWALTWVFV